MKKFLSTVLYIVYVIVGLFLVGLFRTWIRGSSSHLKIAGIVFLALIVVSIIVGLVFGSKKGSGSDEKTDDPDNPDVNTKNE